MNNHTKEILEYNKIIENIRGNCLTPFGAEKVLTIEPLTDREEIKNRLTELSQMKDIVNFGTPFPLYRLDDCREIINKTAVEGSFLEPNEFLKVLHLIDSSIELNRYQKDERENFPLIAEYLTQIRAFPEIKKSIKDTFDNDGYIVDNASKKLRQVRLDLSDSKQKIQRKLQQIANAQPKQAGWQDDIVTIRNDRYVISIPTNQYQSDMGILHDRSQSGGTFFIEPKETVELNNRINMLYQEEQIEIIRILRNLTKLISSSRESLLNNAELIGELDRLHASALFSNKINGVAPEIKDKAEFNFKQVRHPLLILQFKDIKKVIPNDLALNEDRQITLITGPNTGGKTVLLKTVGLSILLAQSGLHISADQFSSVGIFDKIFADIGDEQSLELSLSTFSSHIRNIITGLEKADDKTLLLYDEIGAGTDPREGSALAEATIIYGLKQNARMIVSTHYSQLKTLAMEYPEIENGSFDFDRETLTPTYQLRLGIPGSSYAVEIAQRLGMPKELCDKANSLISSGEKSLDKLISSLEEELKVLKRDKLELSEKLDKAKQLEQFYTVQNEKLKNNIEDEKEKALSSTKQFLETTRKEIENLVAEIRKSQASEKAVKDFHKKLKESEKSVREMISKPKKKPVDHSKFSKGDAVEILSINQLGEIEELVGNSKARVKVGNIFTTVAIRDLKKSDKKLNSNKSLKTYGTSYYNNDDDATISPEIHLRGMTVDEALLKLETYLDKALVAGLHQVYVIHGKGAGILRRTLTDYLKSHKDVASLRLGDFNEGGLGVTVVKLKD